MKAIGGIKKDYLFKMTMLVDCNADYPGYPTKERAKAWNNLYDALHELFDAYGCAEEYAEWSENGLMIPVISKGGE